MPQRPHNRPDIGGNPAARRRVWNAIGLIAGVGLIAYIATQRDLLDAVTSISIGDLLLLLLVAVVGLAALGLQFRTVATMFGLSLAWREWFGLTAVNAMVSYAVPARGGLVVRAMYLSRVHNMSLARYGSLTALSMFTTLATAAVIGMSVSLIALEGASRGRVFRIFALAVVGLGVLAIVVPLTKLVPKRLAKVADALEAFREGLRESATDRGQLLKFGLVTIVFFLIQGFGLWLAFRAVGSQASLAEGLVVQSAASVSFVLAVTPGGIGIKEGVTVVVASLLSLDANLALLAALVDRAAVALAVFAVGLALGPGLSSRAAITDPA